MVATRSADKPKQAKLEDFGGVAGAVAAAGGRGASTSTTATTKKQQPVSQEKTSSSKRKSSDTANTTTTTAAGNGPQQRRGTKRRAGGRGASAKEASSTTDADDSASPLDPHRPSAANPEAIKGNGPVSPALKRQRGDDGGAAGAGGDKAGKQGGSAQQGSKQQQQQQHFSADASSLEKPIVINRSPVLQLWGACVAGFLHPELGWEVCLNIGGAIAALCAVSKGRAIGMIEPKDEDPDKKAKKEDTKQKALKDAEVYTVMSFPLPVRNAAVLLSGTPKTVKESTIVAKFGGQDAYDRIKDVMQSALKSWESDREELDRKAFGMYERFRPSVPPGEKGWGRKGELNPAEVESAIAKS